MNFAEFLKTDLFIEHLSEVRVKGLCIYIDGRLNLDYHVEKLCKKASTNLHNLARTKRKNNKI